MQLIRHFMADDARRAALNALTRQTFGFDFEKWYAAGYWEGDYLPYAFEENGRLIANVSVNRMRFLLDGQEHRFVQGVFGAQRVPLRDVLARIITDAPTLRLGFAPLPQDAGLFDARPYDGGDDYRLFTLGGALDAIPAQKLYFPELSHA